MKETLHERFPSIDDETLTQLSEFFTDRIKETINTVVKSAEIKPNSLYSFAINTGKMHKSKAEAYLREFAVNAKDALSEINTKVLYTGYNDMNKPVDIYKFDKDHAYIVKYDLGNTSIEQSTLYNESCNQLDIQLLDGGYNIRFMHTRPTITETIEIEDVN